MATQPKTPGLTYQDLQAFPEDNFRRELAHPPRHDRQRVGGSLGGRTPSRPHGITEARPDRTQLRDRRARGGSALTCQTLPLQFLGS